MSGAAPRLTGEQALEDWIHATLLVGSVRVEKRLQLGEVGAMALVLGGGDAGEHPQDAAHVIVLGAQPLTGAGAALLLVERKDMLFLVAEVPEQRVSQLGDARRELRGGALGGSLPRRGEKHVAAPVVLAQRTRVHKHGSILGAAGGAALTCIKPPDTPACHPRPMIELERDGALAVATLARPPVNAIDDELLSRLDAVMDRVSGASVLLLRSSEKAFCAGADLELMRSRFDTDEGRARMVALARGMQRVFARLERLPQVTIAEIGGAAMGGGLELALACDLRIAAESAKLGLPEVRLGLLPGAGGTQRLPRVAGAAVAKRLILGAEAVSGQEAAALGIVQWAVQGGELAGRARAVAAGIAALPAAALAEAKACIGDPDGYERELEATARLLARAETQTRVRAFLEKRAGPAPAPAPRPRGRC